jgi:hypothetical protein
MLVQRCGVCRTPSIASVAMGKGRAGFGPNSVSLRLTSSNSSRTWTWTVTAAISVQGEKFRLQIHGKDDLKLGYTLKLTNYRYMADIGNAEVLHGRMSVAPKRGWPCGRSGAACRMELPMPSPAEGTSGQQKPGLDPQDCDLR